jgi:PPM family protein phosphatase
VRNISVGYDSRIGSRSENQDYCRIEETPYGLIALVCDGMGGANGGKHAAVTAGNRIIESIDEGGETDAVAVITTAIKRANSLLFCESRDIPALHGMGTTMALLMVTENYAVCFHAGDSRIYHLRKGNILHRTCDDSLVFKKVRSGLLTEEEARVSPYSNIITRAVGIEPEIEITVSGYLHYKKGDRFLLCSDGLWGVVPEIQLTKMVSKEGSVKKILTGVMDDIGRIGIDRGGQQDNLTAVIIETEGDSIEIIS